jgi:RNA polymerase sigma-70 factor (ECF subfamily)
MTSHRDDSSLVEACRAGQTEAYGELVARCQGRLYPVVLRLVGSREDALDVLQDAFVRGFEKLDQFRGGSSFQTWIYRIAVNMAMNRLRRGRVRRTLSLMTRGGAGPAYDPPDESPSSVPSERAERAEREAMVESALDALEPDHRAVVILKDFEGRRYEEIGELLGIPVGTVRSRLHRARQQLRRRLAPLAEDDPRGAAAVTDVEQTIT